MVSGTPTTARHGQMPVARAVLRIQSTPSRSSTVSCCAAKVPSGDSPVMHALRGFQALPLRRLPSPPPPQHPLPNPPPLSQAKEAAGTLITALHGPLPVVRIPLRCRSTPPPSTVLNLSAARGPMVGRRPRHVLRDFLALPPQSLMHPQLLNPPAVRPPRSPRQLPRLSWW